MKKVSIFFALIGMSILLLSACSSEQTSKNETEETKSVEQIVVDNMMTRRSIRAYKPEPVPHDVLDIVLKCGIHAPNGMNRQPWEIRIVDDQDFLNELTALYLEGIDENDPRNPSKDPKFRNMFRNAPTVAFIAMQPGLCSQVDCGLLAGNMVNTAWAYGVGSCIQMAPVGFMNTEEAKPYMEKLSFSDGYELLMVIGFGYPDEVPNVKPRDTEKIKYIE